MKKSFANRSECHIRRGYAGELLFDGSQWIASEAKRLPSCFCSSRLDSIFVDIRKLFTRSSVECDLCVLRDRRVGLLRVRTKPNISRNREYRERQWSPTKHTRFRQRLWLPVPKVLAIQHLNSLRPKR